MSKECCKSSYCQGRRPPIAELSGGRGLQRERCFESSRSGTDQRLGQLRSVNLVETLTAAAIRKPYLAVTFLPSKQPLITRSLCKPAAKMLSEDDGEVVTEIYLVRHAQSSMNVKPELLGGRSPWAVLTPWGKMQAQALGQSLRDAGVRFDAVFASPLERAKQTAITMCQVSAN